MKREAEPRWTIAQRDSTKENPETEIISQTNSAVEGYGHVPRSRHDTSLTDNHWLKNGNIGLNGCVMVRLQNGTVNKFESMVAMEEKAYPLPSPLLDIPEPDHLTGRSVDGSKKPPEPGASTKAAKP